MYGNKYTISDNGVVPCDDDDTPTRTTQAAQRQINAILASRTTTSSIKAFTNQAKRNYDEFFFLRWLIIQDLYHPLLLLCTQRMATTMPSCTIDGIMPPQTIPVQSSVPVQTSHDPPSTAKL